jgi:hypothetical protein
MWVWLTLLVVALVVLALAGYLILAALALRETRRHLAGVADALEATARHTAPVERQLVTINGALSAVAVGLEAADRHLGRAASAFGL